VDTAGRTIAGAGAWWAVVGVLALALAVTLRPSSEE
jgi:hypothetical protein